MDDTRVQGFEEMAKALDLTGQRIQTTRDFTLWWAPELDPERKKVKKLLAYVRSAYQGYDVLQVGYPWAGRVIQGSKVLDLYDPRASEIDYRLDACCMESIRDESFDLVICCSVLEHIPRFWLAAAEIQRVARRGGMIWIGVPSVWPYHPSDAHAALGNVNFGGDYWRMNHSSLPVLFDHCDTLACWYEPASAEAGDDPRSGWGVNYVGVKRR